MEEDAASLRMEMDSIRLGSTLSRLPSIPSMSTSGEVELPPKELMPRMRIAPPSSPGAPDCVVTVTPGAMPCRAAEVETIGRPKRRNEDFVDLRIVAFEPDVVIGLGGYFDRSLLVADVGDGEPLAGSRRNGELTVCIGRGTPPPG